MPSSKGEWRTWATSRRAELANVDASISEHLRVWLPPEAIVLGYRAFRTEISLDRLVSVRPDIRWIVARVVGENLALHEWAAAGRRSRFGVLEPPNDAEIFAGVVDICLCPGLVFDRHGYRIGYGKGFFDRWLSAAQPVAVGITHTELVVEALPHEAHDVPMTWLATQAGVNRLE